MTLKGLISSTTYITVRDNQDTLGPTSNAISELITSGIDWIGNLF